jgi:hypothetical protein
MSLMANRFEPWLFLALDRPARLRLMAELATRPPIRHYAGPANRLDRAFRSILSAAQIAGHARARQRQTLIEAIAAGLQLETDFVIACLEDATGEPLAVLLKALALDNVQAQQVLLLASPVGRDTAAFFKLCDLFAGMEPVVAETLTEAWREDIAGAAIRHEPLFADTEERPYPADAGLERQIPPAEQARGDRA